MTERLGITWVLIIITYHVERTRHFINDKCSNTIFAKG